MYQWALILGFVVSFVLAFGLGANDVSNAFATSIGAKVISMRSACIIASVAEFGGSVALGGFVTEIIRKSTINDGYLTSDQEILGMFSSLLTVSIWLILATWLKLPVSTTHSVFSSIIGFLIVQNSDAVNWTKMIEMMIAWIIGPLASGILSTICFLGVAYFVLKKDNPYKAGLIAIPYVYVFTLAVNLCFIIYQLFKRLSQKNPSESFSLYIGIAAAGAAVICILVFFGIMKYLVPYINKKVKSRLSTQNTEKISSIETINQEQDDDDITRSMSRESNYEYTERLFSFLQILSAVFTSFAHGSNDVSNSIGPLLALIQAYQRKNAEEVMSSTSPEMYGLLAYGAVGMIVGLYIWGSRVIETIGKNLTTICPTRGFAIEFGSAMSVLLASVLGYSVSTTHCKVGSIIAVGWFSHKILMMFSIPDTTNYDSTLPTKSSDCNDSELAKQLSSDNLITNNQNSRKRMNWRLVFNIVISWIVTIPVSGFLSAGIYALLRLTL